MSNQSLLDPGTASYLPTADDVFGPVVSSCRQNFDFTSLFEQSTLTLVPAVLLLLMAPLRLPQLYKASVKTRPASVGEVKLVFLSSIACFFLARHTADRLAAGNGHDAVMRLLLEHKAEIEAKGNNKLDNATLGSYRRARGGGAAAARARGGRRRKG
jgi:hypothetical protein